MEDAWPHRGTLALTVVPMPKLRNFPSYRLRHAIRVWRYKRRHPWQFSDGKARQHDHVVRLPESEELDRERR